MRIFLRLAGMGLLLTVAPVNAASLCNCCTTGTAESCSAVCAPAKPAIGQCVARVDYAGEAVIADGDNPLYGISLLGLDLKDAMRPELEGVRRLLEDSRRGIEKDRKTSALALRRTRFWQLAGSIGCIVPTRKPPCVTQSKIRTSLLLRISLTQPSWTSRYTVTIKV